MNDDLTENDLIQDGRGNPELAATLIKLWKQGKVSARRDENGRIAYAFVVPCECPYCENCKEGWCENAATTAYMGVPLCQQCFETETARMRIRIAKNVNIAVQGDYEAGLYSNWCSRPRPYPKPVPVGRIGAYFDGLLFSDGSVYDNIIGLEWEKADDFRKCDTAAQLQEMIEGGPFSSQKDAEKYAAEVGKYPQIPALKIVESEEGRWTVVYAK